MTEAVLTLAPPDHLSANLRHLPSAARVALPAVPETAQRDQTCTDVNRREEAASRRLIDRLFDGEEPPLIILVGAGLGYVLDALEERPCATKVLAIEPVPAMTRAMLSRRDWSGWLASKRLTLLVAPDYAGAADAWRLVPSGGRTPPTLVLPALDGASASEHVTRAKHVAAQIVAGAKANDEARKRFAGRYLLNTLGNIPTIVGEGDTAALRGAFTGMPAVVVGAGPSLDATLGELAAVADRTLVVAVDTAVRPLLAAGLRPHLVVSVDPSDDNARHLRDLPDTRGMWLVGEGSLDLSVWRQFAGRAFTFRVSNHHPWPWLARHGAGRGSLQAWGSVLTTAFDLAHHAGCGPIAFVGADLAYTGGVLYCRNTVYEPEWRHLTTAEQRADEFRDFIKRQGQVMERGVTGEHAITAPRFVHFRDWLVARSQSTDRRVVNASGAGILMGGRVELASLSALDLRPIAGGSEIVPLRLRAAWSTGEARRATELERVAAAAGNPGRDAIDAWFAFGGDTVTRSQIKNQTKSIAEALQALNEQRAFLAAQRRAHDLRVGSRADAEELSHGNYAIAARKAPSTQTHVLLDYLQRTYRVDPRANIADTLRTIVETSPGLRALDFGCGVGRSMEPLARCGILVDGVDISARLLEHARSNPVLERSRFFLGRGHDCGDAPDGAYDLVYSHLCFRYIPSRTVRRDILRAVARALRPGGVAVVQMRYHADRTASTIPAPHVPWSADHHHARLRVGEADVWPTPDELHLVYEDFATYFHDIRLQFLDFPAERGLPNQLLVSGSTTRGLADRIYAATDPQTAGVQGDLFGH